MELIRFIYQFTRRYSKARERYFPGLLIDRMNGSNQCT